MTRMLNYYFNLFLALFSVGAIIYGGIEIIFRGYTHWTMLILGGICFCALYLIDGFDRLPIIVKCLCGAFFITVSEFICGCIVNIWLGWTVWDYSDRMFNIMGQICPLFSVFWFLLCIPGYFLAGAIRRRVNECRSN